jgi:hypothetical protein
MSITVTENWSGRTMSKAPPWRANRQFVVTEAATIEAAMAVLPVRRNDPWSSENPSLLANEPIHRESKGPFHFVFDVPYDQPTFGYNPNRAQDPLLWKPTYSMVPITIAIPVDIDLGGRPIVNGSSDPFDPPTRDVTAYQLIIYRNEPFFDLDKAKAINNTVNKSATTIQRYPIDAEHCKLNVYRINGAGFDEDAKWLPCAYEFTLFLDDSLGKYPFQHPFFNQGTQGWYDDGGTKKLARFSDGNGNLIDKPVPLTVDGRSMGSNYSYIRVGASNAAQAVNPNAVDGGTNPPTTGHAKSILVYKTEAVEGGVRLIYEKCRAIEFSVLGL